jgi:hypothetical protein
MSKRKPKIAAAASVTAADLDSLEKLLSDDSVWDTTWEIRCDDDFEEYEVHGGRSGCVTNCVAERVSNRATAKLIAAMKNALPGLIAVARKAIADAEKVS